MRYEAIGGRSYDTWPGSKSSTGLAFGNQLHYPLWGFPDFKAIYRFIFQAGSPDCSEPITAECNFLALMEKICEVSGKGWK